MISIDKVWLWRLGGLVTGFLTMKIVTEIADWRISKRPKAKGGKA